LTVSLVSFSAKGYGPMQGFDGFRGVLAKFLRERVFVGGDVQAGQLVCGVGVSAILSNLFYALCEPGDSVLIPAPYYSVKESPSPPNPKP